MSSEKEEKRDRDCEKWWRNEHSKKREKRSLFAGLELGLHAEMKKKMIWAILKHCDDGYV